MKGAGGKIAGGAKNAAASAAGALASRPDLLGRLGIYGMLLAPRTLADGTLPRESRSAADGLAHLRRAGIHFLPSKRTAAGTPLMSAQNAATPPDKLLSPLFSTQTAAYQAALSQQTAAFQTALSADTAAVTAGLDRMSSALASAGGTIETNVSLNIDGRTVANEVSRHQYSLLNRGRVGNVAYGFAAGVV